ncbi:multiple epidermal growth factor-like domains protein 10 [Saccostrea cucullata]|uniref:multiple epidermal growth factor-like domains protein 10 n=1 Tax=Saccostrea cuccullata TaxID=36930 RepID=UPI002ED2C32C
MVVTFYKVFQFLFCLDVVYTQQQCVGDNGVECCEGYMWNNNIKQCIKCLIGYLGTACDFKCPYPSFGDSCQERCSCNKTLCHFALGCTLDASSRENVENHTLIHQILTTLKPLTNYSTMYNVARDKDEKYLDKSTKELLFVLVCVNSVVVLAAVIYIFKCIVKRAQTTRGSHHASNSLKDSGHDYETAEDTERNVAYNFIPDQQYSTVTVNISSPDQVQGDQGSPEKRRIEENISVLNSQETGGYLIPSSISLA